MKIFSISNMDIWLWGQGKGIPSIFFPQREFAKRKDEVHFLCNRKEAEPKFSTLEGINIYRIDFPFNFRKNIYIQTDNIFDKLKASLWYNLNWLFSQFFNLFWGLRIGLRIKPDIVYGHSPASVIPAYLVSKIVKAKLIIRLYGLQQLYWRRGSFWFRIKRLRDYLVFKIPADYFIITNDGTYGNLLAKELGVEAERIKYWRNGIDGQFYKVAPTAKKEVCDYLKIDPTLKIITSTSRINYEYGVDKLLRSVIDLFKRDSNCACIIASSGPQRKELQDLVEREGFSSRVFFTGIVDRQMVKKILYASDIFVLLARHHNCTNTMWEAMACGKCIVTTETEAIKEILTSEKDAILVSHHRLDNTTTILQELLSNDDLRKKLGDNARKRAKDILEPWSKRTEKEAQLLEDLIKIKQ